MSKLYTEAELLEINNSLKGKTPQEIVKWGLKIAKKPLITTNFRPYEGSILHLSTEQKPDLKVVWCDTGYNTPNTYRHAEELIQQLNLNIHLYVPKQTSSHRDIVMGIPDIENPLHKVFTEQVKLEPFKKWVNTFLKEGDTVYSYVAIRADEEYREGYISKDKNLIVKLVYRTILLGLAVQLLL